MQMHTYTWQYDFCFGTQPADRAPDANTLPLIPRLLPRITEILKQYQHDPTALCSLAIRLLKPLTFTQVMGLASEEALLQALRSPAPAANILGMAVLEKAARSPADAAILATMKPLVAELVVRWLRAPQVEVGERGARVLGDLLDVDCDVDTRPPDGLAVNGLEIAVRGHQPGQGLMWRRVLQDRDIYGTILALCSAGPHQRAADDDADDVQSPNQLTLAQGRLLRLVPRLAALNLAAVSRTEFPDLQARFAQTHAHGDTEEGGLLHFVGLHMIDPEDMLMQLTRIDFFETLLSIQRVTPFSAFKMETLRRLLRDATRDDEALKTAILSLPDRTVPEEAGELRTFTTSLLRP